MLHIQEINIKNRVYNCYIDNLFKVKKQETKTFQSKRKIIRIWWFILLNMLTVDNKNVKSVLS